MLREILFARFMGIDSAFRMEEIAAVKGFIFVTGPRKKEPMVFISGWKIQVFSAPFEKWILGAEKSEKIPIFAARFEILE